MRILGYARPIRNHVKVVLNIKNFIEMGQLQVISQTKHAYG
jgi:hypothetical protein